MSKLGKIKKIFNIPLVATHLCMHWPFNKISDERFLKIFFRAYQGRKLDLENPKSFNEKLQWLKIHDRKDEYTTLTDKYLVREYVKEKIGEKYLIPLLGVWDNAKDIDFDSLPDEFVLKCNHDSGSVVICKDKKTFDKKKAINGLYRTPEAVLIALAVLGGAFGAYMAMQRFRHKTKHLKFTIGIPVILALQIVLAVCVAQRI